LTGSLKKGSDSGVQLERHD
ncbi:unnamed protein product, partial [Didymodactylos carnosus]